MASLPDPADIDLIAFDLDGTLFGADTCITDRTATTLARIADLGVHLVIASGRSQTSIIPRTGNVPFIRWAVCSNGATLYDLVDRDPARVWTIDEAHLAAMLDVAEVTVPGIVWAWEDVAGHNWTEGFTAADLHHAITGTIVTDDARPGVDTVKVLAGHPQVRRYDLLDALEPVIPHDLGISTSGSDFVEITAAGVNKAAGLADLCAGLGVEAANVAAFGDNINDLEMMAWAGHGFAMANAHPRLTAISRYRTEKPHHMDGVALTLETLFDLG